MVPGFLSVENNVAHCSEQNAHLVISSVALDGVFWLPEDVMARPTVMMTVMKKTVVCVR